MLFNYEYLDESDSSEDCLVAKVLLGLIFNPFVPANSKTKYKLSREFLKYYLDDRENDLNFSKAEILFKPKYSWFNTEKKEVKDHTAPDLLLLFPKDLLFPNDAVIAFEVKYTLPIKPEGKKKLDPQLQREYEGLKFLQKKFDVKEKYVFLLMTHQRLFQHINGRPSNKGLGILRKCCNLYGDEFRVNTWNCVYQAIENIGADYLPDKKEILHFLKRKENYMTNPLDGTKKRDLVKLISRENDELPLYRWNEVRDLILHYKDYKMPRGSVRKLTGEAIYENGKRNGNLWVGRKDGIKTIKEDIKADKWRTRKYYVNSGGRPSGGRIENWISSKTFTDLVDGNGE